MVFLVGIAVVVEDCGLVDDLMPLSCVFSGCIKSIEGCAFCERPIDVFGHANILICQFNQCWKSPCHYTKPASKPLSACKTLPQTFFNRNTADPASAGLRCS